MDVPHVYPHPLVALCVGPEAVALRSTGGSGHVLAVLRNAVYLQSDNGRIVSIVAGEVDGPLTVRVADLAPLRAALGPDSTAPFRATAGTIWIAGAPEIEWARAATWKAASLHTLGAPEARLHTAHILAKSVTSIGSEEGCGPVVAQLTGARHAIPLRAVASRAMASFNSARDALRGHSYADAAGTLTSLLGLGPGLTPSGDDLLAGITASLIWQSRPGSSTEQLARSVVAAIRAAAPSRTNRISARLLWYACEGLLYAPAMDLGAALLQGDADAIPADLKQLSAIGSTTGVDLATGLFLGLLFGFECEQIAYNGCGNE